MVSTTPVLALQLFVGSDTVDLVTHVSTGISQKCEDLLTGAAYPAGNLTVDFNSASNRTLTAKNTGAGVANLACDGAFLPVAADGAALGTSALPLSDLFLASGAVIDFNAADVVLTHTANTLTLTGGNLVISGAITASGAVTTAGVTNTAGTASMSGTGSVFGERITTALTKATGGSGNLEGVSVSTAITVAGGATADRATGLEVNGITATVTGTLTNHNAAHFGTPVNGGTVRVIDTDSGGYLTTGGIWTNNPSFAALKRDIVPITSAERASLLDWLISDYKPIRYRYANTWINEVDQRTGKQVRKLARYERDDIDYPHVGFLLDDMPQNIREIVCSDVSGGVSSADVGGFLLLLLKETARRLAVMEGKVN